MQGLEIAKEISSIYKLPLTEACKAVTSYEQHNTKHTKSTGMVSHQLLSAYICGNIENIVYLNSPTNNILTSIASHFTDSIIINVSNFYANTSASDKYHSIASSPNLNNTHILEANSKFTGLAWNDPLIYAPIDLLIIDTDIDYDTLHVNFYSWEPHVRTGGGILFNQIKSHPDNVGILLSGIKGHKVHINDDQYLWIKDSITEPVNPNSKQCKLNQIKHKLLDSHTMANKLSRSDRMDTFQGNFIWPDTADTMIGSIRMEALQQCIERVLQDNIPGDFIETGVWRGGASIFMRAILQAWDDTDRTIWLADSYEGLPAPNPVKYPADQDLNLHQVAELSVSLEQVRENFRKYELLDHQVAFIKGWFRESLLDLPIDNFAILRLDGDLYESTMDALNNLYHKLSPGGYIIIDDYWALRACRQAVDDFRRVNHINEPIERIDWTGIQWRRKKDN